MSASEQTIDSLLDETLDDLADLPQSKPFPPGAHNASLVVSRDAKKASMYYAKFVYKDTMEFSAPTAEVPKPGDEAVMFIHTKKKDGTPNEFGQGQLKMILAPLSEKLGTKNITELLEATKPGIDVAIVSGIRKQDGYQDQMALTKILIA